jgi:hypothetical protein
MRREHRRNETTLTLNSKVVKPSLADPVAPTRVLRELRIELARMHRDRIQLPLIGDWRESSFSTPARETDLRFFAEILPFRFDSRFGPGIPPVVEQAVHLHRDS